MTLFDWAGLSAHATRWLQQIVGEVPAWNWTLQLAGMLTAYAGAELNARMRISGFYIWMVSNVTLAVLHAATGLWILLLLDALFLRVNVLGIMRWSRQHEKPAAVAAPTPHIPQTAHPQ